MTNTPSPTDEDRELIAKLRKPDAWSAHIHGNGSFSTVEEAAPFKAADRLESLLSDRAKLEEALLAGTLSMTNTQVIADFDTREDAELFYERLAIVLLNRSTDHTP